jgi:DNA-binding transcriptional LysR family regulator
MRRPARLDNRRAMDRFDAFHLFSRIVEMSSFAQAAASLNIPRATATKAIKELEARLQVRLLERTTRQVRPTAEGQVFYERCCSLLRELEEAESSMAHEAINPRGRLSIDLHGTHANEIVLPRIAEFHNRYPNIEIAVGSGDRLVDLVREGVDVVVRAGEPQTSTLVTRRLALAPQVTCASPSYLAAHGVPVEPTDLAEHLAVNFFSASRSGPFPFCFLVNGTLQTHVLRDWITVNNADTYVTCAEQGGGLIQLPRFHVERQLREGTLVEVLSHTPCPPMIYSVQFPNQRNLPTRVRVFVDWVVLVYAERFGLLA